MKDPDQLIQVVTKHLSEYSPTGRGKPLLQCSSWAAAQCRNILLINKLGESYGDLTQQAKDANIVLGEEQTKALAEANDGLNQIGQQVKGSATSSRSRYYQRYRR